jgi:hypothetical protein
VHLADINFFFFQGPVGLCHFKFSGLTVNAFIYRYGFNFWLRSCMYVNYFNLCIQTINHVYLYKK